MNNSTVPWIEKYRPHSLKDLFGHEDVLEALNHFLANRSIPHLLLHGPAGTGKTSAILALAQDLFGLDEFFNLVLELNASDDRGIDVIRDKIIPFCKSQSLFATTKQTKLIVLDEADAMTTDAQNALKRVMEIHTKNVRFCLICNHIGKIIDPIQSRCKKLQFNQLSTSAMIHKLKQIAQTESMMLNDDSALEALVLHCRSDLRQAINWLQILSTKKTLLSVELVYETLGVPSAKQLQEILATIQNESNSFQYLVSWLSDFLKRNHFCLLDIVQLTAAMIVQDPKYEQNRSYRVVQLANLEHRLHGDVDQLIQMASFIGILI